MTTATKITLSDFGPDQVWYVSVGSPMGVMIDLWWEDDMGGQIAMEPYDLESAIPFDWDLEGTINSAGEWAWDGEGNPTDMNCNTVTAIKAFRSAGE